MRERRLAASLPRGGGLVYVVVHGSAWLRVHTCALSWGEWHGIGVQLNACTIIEAMLINGASSVALLVHR